MILEKDNITRHFERSVNNAENFNSPTNYRVEVIEVQDHIQNLFIENVSQDLCAAKRDILIHALSVAQDHQLNSLTKENKQLGYTKFNSIN